MGIVAEGFEDRLLGRKPARQMLVRKFFGLGVIEFLGAENMVQETSAPALDCLLDALDFDDVNAGSDDVHLK